MMGGNPSWWWSMMLNPPPSLHQPSSSTIFSSSPPTTNPYLLGSPYSLPLNSSLFHYNNHDLPHSWNQHLLGGLTGGDEDDHGLSGDHFQSKKLENWEEHQTFNISSPRGVVVADVKQENSQNITNLYGHGADEEFQAPNKNNINNILPWSQQVMPVSSPRSCVTSGISSSTSSNNILDFSYNNTDNGKNQLPYLSSECNNTATGSVSKKARVQTTSTQPPLKVRKEKLGERITALHQLVSPFGKTDTASVLLEVIGYIRFLQGQIEALSSPYLATASSNIRNQQSVQRHRNGVFPEDPSQDSKDKAKDLRSRGLCLVPVSCTQHVGGNTENGADYWAPPVDFDERHAWK